MKLKYRILEKLHNVSNSEMDLLVWAVQHSDEASGTMYGAYYKDYKWKTAWVGRRRPRKRSQKHAHLHF